MKRHQILGKELRATLEYTLHSLFVRGEAKYLERTAPGQIQQQFNRALSIGDSVICAVLDHLGYGPINGSSAFVNRGVDRSIEYFFGDWWVPDESDAKALDKSRPDRALQWFGVLPNALFLCALTGRWDDAAKICSWIDSSIQLEYQFELTDYEHQMLYLCIVSSLRPEPLEGVEKMLEFVKKAKAKRPRLLCAVWEAVVARDQKAFDKALKQSVTHFLKVHAENVPNVCFWVALDESLLWLIAERNGLTFPVLPENLDAAIVRRQTVRLT